MPIASEIIAKREARFPKRHSGLPALPEPSPGP
jgi:hypothetical protein